MKGFVTSTGRILKRSARHVGLLVGVVGLFFVARELARNWGDVVIAAKGAHTLSLVVAFLCGAGGMVVIALTWGRCLAALGDRRQTLSTLHWYFVGELGKYIPGGVWAVLGRSEMARRSGVSGGVSYASTMWSLATAYLAATLVAIFAFTGRGLGGGGWLWLTGAGVALAGLLALHPSVLVAVLDLAERIVRRDINLEVPSWTMSAALVARQIPAWLAVGGSTWFIAAALDNASPSFLNIAFATAVAWIAGLLAVPVPGGIGVREAVFVSLATTLSSSGMAAAVALTARVAFVLIDLLGALLLAVAIRWAARSTSAA